MFSLQIINFWIGVLNWYSEKWNFGYFLSIPSEMSKYLFEFAFIKIKDVDNRVDTFLKIHVVFLSFYFTFSELDIIHSVN